MKPTILQISPNKFWRLKETKGSRTVIASVFDEATWQSQVAYTAFRHGDYIYTMMRTKETNMKACFKRFPVGYKTTKSCLLVSKCRSWI